VFNLRKLSAFLRRKPPGPYERAVRNLQTGSCEKAERAFSELLKGELSKDARTAILNKRGISRVYQGRREEALTDFSAALGLDPTFAPSLVNLGNLLLEDGDLEEAIVHYECAVRSDDSYSVAHVNLAAAYKKAGRHADAVRQFRRANRVQMPLFGKIKR